METAVVCWRSMSFQHSNCEAREWLSSQGCCCSMATGVSGHSYMPFKVALHPSGEDLGIDLVVWMEAAKQKKKNHCGLCARIVRFDEASTPLLSCSISPSWLGMNNWPHSLGPCSLPGEVSAWFVMLWGRVQAPTVQMPGLVFPSTSDHTLVLHL